MLKQWHHQAWGMHPGTPLEFAYAHKFGNWSAKDWCSLYCIHYTSSVWKLWMDIYSPAATRSHFTEIASHYMAHYNITIINSSSHHHAPMCKTLVMPLRLNWHVAMTDTNFVNQSVFTFMLAIVLTLSYIIQYWMNDGYNVTNKCKLWPKCRI